MRCSNREVLSPPPRLRLQLVPPARDVVLLQLVPRALPLLLLLLERQLFNCPRSADDLLNSQRWWTMKVTFCAKHSSVEMMTRSLRAGNNCNRTRPQR